MPGMQMSARLISVLSAANIVVSITVTLIIDLFQKTELEPANSILLGMVLFCATSLLESLYFLAELRIRAVREEELWDVHEPADSRLASMRKSLRTIEKGVDPRTDIFLKYFHQKIHDLESDIRHTANTLELRVDSGNLDLSRPLLDSLTGVESDIIRIVHLLSHNDDLFNPHEAQWFNTVLRAVDNRKVIEVRRLLVSVNDDEENHELSRRLMRFHTHTPHYDYRLMRKPYFERLARSFRLQGSFVDFGLYGIRYLFRGISYDADDFVGMYARDATTIDRYVKFFDMCWASPGSRQADPTTLSPISVQDFFAPMP
jgi:hypothetical protein